MSDHGHAPGELPSVHDEAADTPLWFPALGVGLLALLAFFVVLRQSAVVDPPSAEPVAAEALADIEAAPAPAPAPPPAAIPAPAPAPAAAERDARGRAAGDEHFGHDHD